MLDKLIAAYRTQNPAPEAEAHCDGPCGVYDPASARIAAEAVLSMSKKLSALTVPDSNDAGAWAHYLNHFARYVAIKEEQAHLAKEEILVLWTDFFKPEHLAKHPDLHTLIWETTKLASMCKQHVDVKSAEAFLANIHKIHDIFWGIKGRDIQWYTT